ncbi:MAG: CBS domain-containing protein [Planctomycetota bacterium]
MATVGVLLEGKGDAVVSVGPDVTVREAAGVMNLRSIGALLVCEGDELAGIFTERDVLRRVVAEGLDPTLVRVSEVMTREVVYCEPETTLGEARSIFKRRRVRHLPVLGRDGRVMGVLSIGDVNAYDLVDRQVELTYLREYLFS